MSKTFKEMQEDILEKYPDIKEHHLDVMVGVLMLCHEYSETVDKELSPAEVLRTILENIYKTLGNQEVFEYCSTVLNFLQSGEEPPVIATLN